MRNRRSPPRPPHAPAEAPDRRRLLLALGAAGGGALIGGLAPAGAETAAVEQGSMARDSGAFKGAHPVYGPQQAGVTTPRPAAAMAVSFDVLAQSRAELDRLFRKLTERIVFLTQGGTPPQFDPRLPPADSGMLGPTIAPDDLTLTVAVGASLFDDRFGLGPAKPRQLVRMTGFSNDALDPSVCHGDLLLQICSNTVETNIHALRDIVKNFPDLLAVRWRQEGFLPPAQSAPAETSRNLLGFKDGTSNPDPDDAEAMRRIVWVQPQSPEPAWARDGTYAVVRLIRHFVERWDRTPLQEQEAIFGRTKMSGAPLGMADEQDIPDFAADPLGHQIPLDAHIRLANPRTPATEANRILRRSYNYSREVTRAGQLDMGLLFICFQADLERGFITVQNRLKGEPLEEYIKPFGGGYFFVLPGFEPGGHLGRSLLEWRA